MNRDRIDAKSFVLLAIILLSGGLLGCSTPAVGAPCLPEQVPEDGFSDSEQYVESSSVQCETRVCLVWRLRGDPREGCVPKADPNPNDNINEEKVCATPEEVRDHVYCTCRCDSDDTGFAECECPDGFTCTDVLNQGGPGVRGGYCVKNNTVTSGG